MHSTPFARVELQQRAAAGSAGAQQAAAAAGGMLGGGSSSNSNGTCSPAGSSGSADAPGAAAPAAVVVVTPPAHREWLYRLVTFPSYFTPCPACCANARAPKREQLLTQFDTSYPFNVYCSTCPACKERAHAGVLLQVRRSAFKDVVKAADIVRYGADVGGVQQYTLNGSKVIYLNREQAPEKKPASASTAPASCSVDGRAMMDKSSTYCSLKCKMTAEDPGFTRWLDGQHPSVRILAQAAANAPPRPTLASKRTATGGPGGDSSDEDDDGGGDADEDDEEEDGAAHSLARSGGSSGGTHSRAGTHAGRTTTTGASSRPPKKCARTLSASLADGSGLAAAAGLHRANAAAAAGPGAGLKRIRVNSLPSGSGGSTSAAAAAGGLQRAGLGVRPRQASAPSGVFDAALGGSGLAAAGRQRQRQQQQFGWRAGGACGCVGASASSWGDLSDALTAGGGGGPTWEGAWDALERGLDSPCAVGPGSAAAGSWEADGSMSPALIHAPSAFFSDSSPGGEGWWGVAASPGLLEGAAFASAGMGALLLQPAPASGSGLSSHASQPSAPPAAAAAAPGVQRTSSDSMEAVDSTLLLPPALQHCC
jgi:hypothetical protein